MLPKVFLERMLYKGIYQLIMTQDNKQFSRVLTAYIGSYTALYRQYLLQISYFGTNFPSK